LFDADYRTRYVALFHVLLEITADAYAFDITSFLFIIFHIHFLIFYGLSAELAMPRLFRQPCDY